MALSQKTAELVLKQQDAFERIEGVLKNLRKFILAQRNVKNGQRYWSQAKEAWVSFSTTHQELTSLGDAVAPAYMERCHDLISMLKVIKDTVKAVGVEIAEEENEKETLNLEPRVIIITDERPLITQPVLQDDGNRATGARPKIGLTLPPPRLLDAQELLFTPPD